MVGTCQYTKMAVHQNQKKYEKESKRKTERPTNAEVEESMAKHGYAQRYKERTITYKPEGVSSGMNLDMFAPNDKDYKYIVHPDRSKPGYWGAPKYFKTEEEAKSYIDEELKKKKK